MFSERLIDRFYGAAAVFLGRQFDPNRRFVWVARERLRRPTPAAIEQRVCCRNASVRGVAVSQFLEQALDRLNRMASSELPDLGNPTWTAAGVTRTAGCPLAVRKTHCHLIEPCSEEARF
jgi:hypothetical protein